jgi:hypothetical protein
MTYLDSLLKLLLLKKEEFDDLNTLQSIMKDMDNSLIMSGDNKNEIEKMHTLIEYVHDYCINKFEYKPFKKLKKNNLFKINIKKNIKRISNPSIEEFQKYLDNKEPIILTDCIQDWKCFKFWSDFDYLKRVAGLI